MKAYIYLICLCLFFTGCTTVQKSESFPKINDLSPIQPVASIVVENYGYYLFGIWPIWCGNAEKPNAMSSRFFKDTVTIDNNVSLIKKEADSYGENVSLGELKTEVETSGSFSAWILWRKIITTSACVYEIDKELAELKEVKVKQQQSE